MKRHPQDYRKIVTIQEYPTKGAWRAFDDNWDLGDPVGHGDTELEAIIDLLEKEEE